MLPALSRFTLQKEVVRIQGVEAAHLPIWQASLRRNTSLSTSFTPGDCKGRLGRREGD